jgi:hypothetical protein
MVDVLAVKDRTALAKGSIPSYQGGRNFRQHPPLLSKSIIGGHLFPKQTSASSQELLVELSSSTWIHLMENANYENWGLSYRQPLLPKQALEDCITSSNIPEAIARTPWVK